MASNSGSSHPTPPQGPAPQHPHHHHAYYPPPYGQGGPSLAAPPYRASPYATPEKSSHNQLPRAGVSYPPPSGGAVAGNGSPPHATKTPQNTPSTATPPRQMYPEGYNKDIPPHWAHSHMYGVSPYHPRDHSHPIPQPHYHPAWGYGPPHGPPHTPNGPPPPPHYYAHMSPGPPAMHHPGVSQAPITATSRAPATPPTLLALAPKGGKKPDEPGVLAGSPSQMDGPHRDDVHNLGCTCKRTRCLKLYCQCFGAKLYCGAQCRCVLCCNVPRCEKVRKEAQRLILVRNPGAFDTKFRKLPHLTGSVHADLSPVKTTSAVNGSRAPIPGNVDGKVLAHKVGCRCKRSNCIKKYCECFAGFVKCTPSCRCVACKNMGPSLDDKKNPSTTAETVSTPSRDNRKRTVKGHMRYAPPAPPPPPPPMHHPHYYGHPLPPHLYPPPGMHPHLMPRQLQPHSVPGQPIPPPPPPPQPPVSSPPPVPVPPPVPPPMKPTAAVSDAANSGEPWLAAQNLTFLKRGSPPSEKKQKLESGGSQDLVSMPSLAESSEGTYSGEPIRGASSQEETEGGAGVSSLLLAAMAMTEFASEKLTQLTGGTLVTAKEAAPHTPPSSKT